MAYRNARHRSQGSLARRRATTDHQCRRDALHRFARNQQTGQLADLEVRHRLRARSEDRIRNAKDTGLANLPLHSFAGNTLWCHLVMLAAELMAWTQILALHGTTARRWEPKKLRARTFEIAGKTSRHARRFTVHLAATAPETPLLIKALKRLNTLAPP